MTTNRPETAPELKAKIKAEAEKLGFNCCGFTTPFTPGAFEKYREWIGKQQYGTMQFLARPDHLAGRENPALVFPPVRSVCMLGAAYPLAAPETPETASYAHFRDYHDTLRAAAETLARGCGLAESSYRICVDAAPLLEQALAVQAGLGWIGKSSLLVTPEFGSALLLCEILLEAEIPPDTPYTRDGCGSCTRCQDACPGHCIDPVSRTIDAERCVSYLTIEHKGEFSEEQAGSIGKHVYGCDECLRACPWNRRGLRETILEASDALPRAEDAYMSDSQFRDKYSGSPILRLKSARLTRNLKAVSGIDK